MPRLLQIIAVFLIVLASWRADAFSLLGPVQPFPGNEGWQSPALGYNALNVDIGAPKNKGEEYRWNTPVITYAFDNSFLTYFGNDGVAAIDAAFNIINSLPDLTSLSPNLDEFPILDPATGASTTFRDSRRINLRAEANNLLDLKSLALGLIVEQLGLAPPERWAFALGDRRIVNNNTETQYLTIQRNFDPVTLTPSKYVNGIRYTYEVFEFTVPAYSDAIESTVDPEHRIHQFSSVANIMGVDSVGYGPGVYYTYLTQDDIGGLKYIYNSSNINWEPFPPNTQMFVADRANGLVSLTNQDLTLFSLRSLINPPAAMSNFYPGLVITQALQGISSILSNIPVIVTQTIPVLFITNTQTPLVVSNIDLGTFSSVTLTSAPAVLTANLQAAFPGVAGLDQLVILSTNFSPTTVVQVLNVFITNAPKQPWDDAFTTNFIFVTNSVTNIQILYHYTFRNVLTNSYSPFTTVRRITSGVEKEPWSEALNPIFKTNVTEFLVTRPSGGVIIVPTNVFRYEFTGFNITNIVGITNFAFSTNFIDPNTGLARTISRFDFSLFTNVQFFAYPIEFLAQSFFTNIFVTNAFVTTNVITYDYGFANVITNYAGPNTPAVRTRVEITPDPSNPAFNRTNVVVNEATILPVPSGGFIIDTNMTGFEFSGFSNVVVLSVTNIVFDITDANGLRTVEQLVYNFTNTVYLVFPFILTPPPASALRPGISKVRFQRIGGNVFTGTSYLYTNRYTASFYTNGVLTNAVFLNVQTLPDILIRARDLGRLNASVVPAMIVRSPLTPGSGLQNNAALNSTDLGQGGPGTINGTMVLDFNKIGPTLVNSFPGFVTEAAALNFNLVPLVWGSFDGSTNAPIVFPKEITLENIEILKTGGAVP